MNKTFQEAQKRREDVARSIQEDINNRNLYDVKRASSASASSSKKSSFISKKEQRRKQLGNNDNSSNGDRILS